MHIEAPEFMFLVEQRLACERTLRKAYRAYFARLAGQEAGEARWVDQEEIHPVEAEYRRIDASLREYVSQHPLAGEGDL